MRNPLHLRRHLYDGQSCPRCGGALFRSRCEPCDYLDGDLDGENEPEPLTVREAMDRLAARTKSP